MLWDSTMVLKNLQPQHIYINIQPWAMLKSVNVVNGKYLKVIYSSYNMIITVILWNILNITKPSGINKDQIQAIKKELAIHIWFCGNRQSLHWFVRVVTF